MRQMIGHFVDLLVIGRKNVMGETTNVVNGAMSIPLPEGFHVMDDEERNSISKGQKAPEWVMANEDKHFMFTVSWKEIPALASFLLGPKDVAKSMKKRYGEAAEGAGYTFGEIRNLTIGGQKAFGYPFSYEAEGVAMCGDSIVIKKGKTCYFCHTYYREAMKEESEKLLEELYSEIIFEG